MSHPGIVTCKLSIVILKKIILQTIYTSLSPFLFKEETVDRGGHI